MSKISQALKKVLLFSVIIAIALFGAIKFIDFQISQPLNIKHPQLLSVNSGTSFHQLASQLKKQGIIDTRLWLKSYVKLFPEMGNIKAGTYQITPSMNAKQFLTLLRSGKEHQFSITFIEGSTFKEWLNVLQQHPQITKQLKSTEYSDIAKQLALTQNHPEGLFFPDTYSFTANTSDVDILKRANQKMMSELNVSWKNRDTNLPYNTPYQALIMASIIEKESGQFAEHQLISSVFVNRLYKKMRLQTDPTVIYGLGERYKGDIKRVHLKEKTAYNTYRINGLPPTPIAMPGKSAIYAAMHPESTDYYYFVSQGNGKHIFSTNLKAHNKAVVKYQLN